MHEERTTSKRLAGRTALVTGASSGIGRPTAKALAAEGAAVALAARREERLEALAAEIEAEGATAVALPVDLADRVAVRGLADRGVAALGDLDLLVNNAGAADWTFVGVLEADLDQWLLEVEVNQVAVMALTHAAAKHMAARGGGDIVTISSLAGCSTGPNYPGDQTSKGAATASSTMASAAQRRQGVRRTVVEPGEVDTPMQPDEDRAKMRMLDPSNVADAVLYAVTRPAHVCVRDVQIVPMPRA